MVVTAAVGSAMLISIGMVGEYIVKLDEQSKGRPLYPVARTFHADAAESIKRTWEAQSLRYDTDWPRGSKDWANRTMEV
jgi:hypothetical protein